MKTSILSFLIIFLYLTATGQDNNSAYKYILDYQVPSSPAFRLLDVNPEQVTRGSAAKPLVANLFSNYLQAGKLDPGVALDFSPYLLLGGGYQNIKEYQGNTWKRILANTLVSGATIKNPANESNLDFSLAGRVTLFDSRDLFAKRNSDITDRIGTALAESVTPRPVLGVQPDEIGVPVSVDLSQIYQEAYNKLKDSSGSALSIGFGYRSTAKNSFLVSDSLVDQEYKLWGSFSQYRIFKGADLLSIVQGRFGKGLTSEWKAGIALASQNKNSNMGAELVYNFMNKKLEYGANFEIRLLKQLTYVVSINRRSLEMSKTGVEKLRAISTFRYDLFGR